MILLFWDLNLLEMSYPQGLSLNKNFITPEFEQEIILWLDKRVWNTTLSRRTQHFGFEYDYKSSKVQPGNAAPFEGPILLIANYLEKLGIMKPEQCIANEYYRDQGIAPHIDSSAFGPKIITISLGADTVMEFTRWTEMFHCFLPQRSIAVLEDAARTEWKHGISKNVSYLNENGKKIIKEKDYRRISLTYRTLAK